MLGIWFKALSQHYLDLRIRTGPGISARILERPGLWMQPAAITAMLDDLRHVAGKTLAAGSLDYGIMTGDEDRLKSSVVTILYETKTNTPVAFNALAVMDASLHGRPAPVVHMGLVMVDPGVRSQGFSWVLYGLTCLILFFRNQMRPLWMSNVTQVPAIVGMVCETFSKVFPGPSPQAHRSFEHLLLAQQIMDHHRHVFGVGEDAGFDEKRFVITNAYTGGSDNLKKTIEQAPAHRDAIYNEFCHRELDYARGDDVLQLCQLDLDTARRFIMKDVPRSSWPALLATLLFVSLNRIVLPAVYWLSANKPWGILRAAAVEKSGK